MQKRILIIEDHAETCETLCKLFRRRGFDSTCAESFAEGLACVHSQKFGCIILDPGLKDSDSMETVNRIAEFGDTPVVVLTGNDDRELIRVARHHGAQWCLKGGNMMDVMEKALLLIERVSPSIHTENAIVEMAHERSRGEPKRWFMQWVPLIALAVAIFGASGTGGMFLYRSISDDAKRSEHASNRFESIERSMTDFKLNMETFARIQLEHASKLQSGADDRGGLHRELGILTGMQRDLKEDVVRRLERIEDNQTALLKEMAKRP